MALTTTDVRRPHAGMARNPLILALLVLGLLLAAVLSLAIGSRALGLTTVVRVLFEPDGSTASTIVHGLRIPRTVLGIAVGACLGTAGALMQGHTRNPLAEPGLLGVSFGASFAVVLGIYVFDVSTASSYAWFSLVGAGLASLAVVMIGSTRGGPSPITLVLAGAALSALLGAVTQVMVLSDLRTLDRYRFWAVGSVTGRDLDVFWQVLPFMLVGIAIAVVGTRALNMLQLGDDVARSLGLSPTLHKLLGIAAVMFLAGAATAACGPIAFVGLVVPHVARTLCGVDYRWVVPASGLVGSIFLVLADIVGRVIAKPSEIQVGIVMALVGAPVFVLLVRRMRMARL